MNNRASLTTGFPDAAKNAVVQLVAAARLDEAEAAARDLLLRFPDVHDGWDRLGMVHEARGDSRQAADCYRKVPAKSHVLEIE
jgi:predicted TPR repeat methyltransferase